MWRRGGGARRGCVRPRKSTLRCACDRAPISSRVRRSTRNTGLTQPRHGAPAAATHPESEHRLRPGILCVVSMTLICGCRGWTHDSAAQDFLRSSSTLQQLTLRQFPHKEQIELYLEAMHRGHPPNIGLAHSLAKNGASILPFLIE